MACSYTDAVLWLQLRKMCREGAYWGKLDIVFDVMFFDNWRSIITFSVFIVLYLTQCLLFTVVCVMLVTGTAAGVYVGMEYGIENIRDTRDWVNSSFPISGVLFYFGFIVQFFLRLAQEWLEALSWQIIYYPLVGQVANCSIVVLWSLIPAFSHDLI